MAGGLAIAVMVAIVTINVITRGLFNAPIPGFYDFIGLLGAAFYSFGIVYCAIKGQHIVMSMVKNRLSAGGRRIFDFLSRGVVLIFCFLLIYAGGGYAWQMLISNELTDDIQFPVAPFRFIVVLAFLLLCFLILAGKEISKGDD